jgi:hypothetical protein
MLNLNYNNPNFINPFHPTLFVYCLTSLYLTLTLIFCYLYSTYGIYLIYFVLLLILYFF